MQLLLIGSAPPSHDIFQHLDVHKLLSLTKSPVISTPIRNFLNSNFIYNASFHQGDLFTNLKLAYIVPTHKKGNKALASQVIQDGCEWISCSMILLLIL